MPIEVKRKQGETTRSFLRRFTKVIQQTRYLVTARKTRYRDKEESKREKRLKAIRRIKIGKEKEQLRKKGLLEEEPRWEKKRR